MAVALALTGAACGGDDDEPASASTSPSTSEADAPDDTEETRDCSFVDVDTVNEILGDDPGFVAQDSPTPLLPLEGSITCGFDRRDGKRTVTVARLDDAPDQFEAFINSLEANETTADIYEELDGIGDRAVGGVVQQISSQIAFEEGSQFTVVVCAASSADDELYAHCKEMAAAVSGS